MAGLLTLSPRWIPTPNLSPISEAVSVPCGDYESLKSSIEGILVGQFGHSPELGRTVETVVADWFYRNDGLAHRRTSDAILARLSGARRVNEELCVRFLREHEAARRSRLGLGHAVRRILRLPSDWSFRRMRVVPSPEKTVKYFGVPDVERLVERLALVSGQSGDPGVEPVARLAAGVPSQRERGIARSDARRRLGEWLRSSRWVAPGFGLGECDFANSNVLMTSRTCAGSRQSQA